MYILLPKLLSSEQCDKLSELYYSDKVRKRRLATSETAPTPKSVTMGQWNNPCDLATRIDTFICDAIRPKLSEIQESAHDTYIINELFLYMYYEEGDFFGSHVDFPETEGRRNKLYPNLKTMISWIGLLQRCEEGGVFSIGNQKNLLQEKGDVIVFNGKYEHEVSKIIKGKRLTILNFIYSQHS